MVTQEEPESAYPFLMLGVVVGIGDEDPNPRGVGNCARYRHDTPPD
jgi:hypothetical protein